jgi:hypothetical protein
VIGLATIRTVRRSLSVRYPGRSTKSKTNESLYGEVSLATSIVVNSKHLRWPDILDVGATYGNYHAFKSCKQI